MRQSRLNRCWPLLLFVPGILHAAPQGAEAPKAANVRPGYLIDLRLQGSVLTAVSTAEIDNYVENKHLGSDDDWRVLLLNAGGQPIGVRLIDNPYRFSPRLGDEEAIPLTIKVPAAPALAAVAVQDQRGAERLRIPVDDTFRGRAAAERARFLAHDRENRRLLREAAARRAAQPGGQPASKASHAVHMETLPRELRNHVIADTAEEMGALLRFGPDTLNAARALSVPPEQIALTAFGDKERSAVALPATGESGPYTLTGLVTDANTDAPLVNARITVYQYTASWVYVGATDVYTDPSGRYSCAIATGNIYVYGPYAATGRYIVATWSTGVAGDMSHDIRARPGVALSGRVTNEQAQAVGDVTLRWSSADGLASSTTTSASGDYSMLVPSGIAFRVTVASAPLPYTFPLAGIELVVSADTVQNFLLSSGFVIQGLVSGDGAAVSGASVLVRQIAGTSTKPPSWSQTTGSTGRYAVALPRNLFPNDFIVSVYASGYVRSTSALTVTTDITHDVPLARGVTVSGIVTNSAGAAQKDARVRAFQSGNMLLSTLTDAAGAYALTLAPGTYDLTAVPPSGQQMASTTVPNVGLSGPTTQHFTLPSLGGSIALKLYCGVLSVEFSACQAFDRLELRQGTRTVAAFGYWDIPVSFAYDSGGGFLSISASVAPGQYDVVAYFRGLAPFTFAGVQVAGAVTLSATLPAPFVWTGILRGADGAPIPGAHVCSGDDTGFVPGCSATDQSGRFSAGMTPGGFVQFYTDEGTRNIAYMERFGDVTASRNADCVQDSFPSLADAGDVLTQMYGVADRNSRWNIVMIGDGYTDVHETFTDLNGNGRWDGVLYYDINHDGVWNTGEPYQVYGTAAEPANGGNPTLGNEPFVDLNGDQALSTDDQALFDRNTLDTARALFGQDVWRHHRDVFNIFRIRVVSPQAGHDIRDSSNNTVLDRNTALNTYLCCPERGYIFSGDSSLESQYMNQYVPEVDTRVLIVNQPIRMGRATSAIETGGGDRSYICNDGVISHEMAHNLGGLADEYTEFPGTYTGGEMSAANVTSLSTFDTIPWKHLVTAGKEIPSVPYSGGVGLFEGAQYYPSGAYRPTAHCAMVSGVRFCPVCTKEIEVRVHDIGSPVPVAVLLSPVETKTEVTPTFTWQPQAGVSHYLLEIEAVSDGQLVASFDVYATSFTLASPLAAGTYRWRLRAGSTANWAEWSAWYEFTVFLGPIFADDPLSPRASVVKAVHITELRQAVAALRARFGLPPQAWTDPGVGKSTSVRAVHVLELRAALEEVYLAAGRAAPSYSRPAIEAGKTVIAAVDIAELRAAVLAIW